MNADQYSFWIVVGLMAMSFGGGFFWGAIYEIQRRQKAEDPTGLDYKEIDRNPDPYDHLR